MTTPTPTLPEALRLAEDLIQVHNGHADEGPSSFSEAAAELRRLHAQVEVLSAAQTELAAMRAGGEPVAEMVPCHTPSGKRVAVISRFQHLPIGTKLYTHPQPAAQDAELYQFIRNCSMEDRNKLEHYSKDALDKAIRAAIAAQQGEKT